MLSLLENLQKNSWTLIDLKEHALLSQKTLEEMRSSALSLYQQEQFHPAKIGQGDSKALDPRIRSDQVLWRSSEELKAQHPQLAKFLESLQVQLNRLFYLAINNSEFHFARYGPGNHYDAHYDQPENLQRPENARNPRLISLVIYLNPNWQAADEGRLLLYSDGEASTIIPIEPRWGQMILFDSRTVYHAVEKCNAERLSFTGWFRHEQDFPFANTKLGIS